MNSTKEEYFSLFTIFLLSVLYNTTFKKIGNRTISPYRYPISQNYARLASFVGSFTDGMPEQAKKYVFSLKKKLLNNLI